MPTTIMDIVMFHLYRERIISIRPSNDLGNELLVIELESGKTLTITGGSSSGYGTLSYTIYDPYGNPLVEVE